MKLQSADIIAKNIEKLAELFPSCVSEGKVDLEAFKQLFSDKVIDGEEAYKFTWVGKKAAMVEAHTPIRKTLRPCVEESVNWDTTENLYIEGDNLEVLKLLQENYLNAVKMIYIDPPYNTGNDFIYVDDFEATDEEYKKARGVYDEENNKLFKNTDTNGRFHSDWCSMIYSRLLLARNLLTDDGVIFISIDDNEQANLKSICDEVFGESNFVAQFTWKRRSGANDALKNVSLDHEYIICYSKSTEIMLTGVVKTFENYTNPDNDPRGEWAKDNLTCGKTASQRPNLFYPITDPKTGIIYECNPNRVWSFEKDKMQDLIANGKVIFPKDGKGKPSYKRHKSELRSESKPFSSIIDTKLNTVATKELREILNGQIFNYPKTVDLILQIVNQGTDKNSIILDFFSGSATTAHAVMQLNAEDGGHRKFIMVQLPEPCAEKSEALKAGYKNICEIGKERIRRAGNKIKSDNPLTTTELDIGFRVFKLDTTNMKDVYYSPEELTQDDLFESNIKEDRTDLDLFFGCILDLGLPLSLPHTSEEIDGCTIHDYNDGDLMACFNENIPRSVFEFMAKKMAKRLEAGETKKLRVVFRDSGFKEAEDRINTEEIFKLYAPGTSVKVI